MYDDITLDIKASTMCPALIFAINRTLKVKGRIVTLIVSIITRNGIRTTGEPAGTKWAADALNEKTQPDSKKQPQQDKANDLLNHKLEVKPYVKGVKPIKLFVIIKRIILVNISFRE